MIRQKRSGLFVHSMRVMFVSTKRPRLVGSDLKKDFSCRLLNYFLIPSRRTSCPANSFPGSCLFKRRELGCFRGRAQLESDGIPRSLILWLAVSWLWFVAASVRLSDHQWETSSTYYCVTSAWSEWSGTVDPTTLFSSQNDLVKDPERWRNYHGMQAS